jgi:hypothetical protein
VTTGTAFAAPVGREPGNRSKLFFLMTILYQIMKLSKCIVLLLALACIAMFAAGCTSSKPATTTTAPAATPAASTTSVPAAATTAPAAVSCVDASGKGVWTGTWDTYIGDRCQDNRHHFFAVTADNPSPWTGTEGTEINAQGALTQNNCDVTGTVTILGNVENAKCPISLTGKVDGTSVKGTWKAYCNIGTSINANAKDDSGIFTINMDPTNTGFIGIFQGNSPDVAKVVASDCPTQNGNWAGKKI